MELEDQEKSLKQKIFLSFSIILISLFIFIMPFILFAVPNPTVKKVKDLGKAKEATFLETKDNLFKLFSYSANMNFPKNSPNVKGAIKVLIKYNRLSDINKYSMFRYNNDKAIAIIKKPNFQSKNILLIKPVKNLAPGKYYISMSSSNMFAGTQYFYFKVDN